MASRAGPTSPIVLSPGAAPLRLVVRGLTGNILAELQAPEKTTPAQLKAMLSTESRLGIPQEALHIISLCGHTLQPPNIALVDLGIQDGDGITCLQLQVPLNYDSVGVCSCCDELRHLFYGYTRVQHMCDLEPVIAICQACGGSPENPDASSASEPGYDSHDDVPSLDGPSCSGSL